ncbi:Uncharacterised protein [uncultured Clostridium sp.]|nr:Uncharacterised protein [uncultured Clostridium sp.]
MSFDPLPNGIGREFLCGKEVGSSVDGRSRHQDTEICCHRQQAAGLAGLIRMLVRRRNNV